MWTDRAAFPCYNSNIQWEAVSSSDIPGKEEGWLNAKNCDRYAELSVCGCSGDRFQKLRYTPWKLSERLKLRDRVRELCPDCKIALMVDSNTERQTAKDIRDAKKDGLIDQFFYGSMSAEYLMDQIYAM